jgi:hypothetical protein
MIVKLSVKTHETQIASVAELRAALSPLASERFPRLAALLKGDIGFLMYLRHGDGDPSFTSRRISFDGAVSATIEYQCGHRKWLRRERSAMPPSTINDATREPRD